MARLEEKAKPLLISLIEGRGRTLYNGGRETLATWAIKTAMALEGNDPNTTIPTKHWRHIAANQSPPWNTQVWLGAVEDNFVTETVVFHRYNGLAIAGEDAYASTLSIGHLAVSILGIGAKDPMARKLGGWPREALIQIWPAGGGVRWPPPLILDWKRLQFLGTAEFAAGDSLR
jgi:hypothetical protein